MSVEIVDDTRLLLENLDNKFKEINLFYWIDAGTLLKSYRDHNIVPSSDLDLAIWYKDINNLELFLKKIAHEGFKFEYQGKFNIVESAVKIYIPKKYNVSFSHIDIYIYRENNNEVYNRNIHHPISNDKFSRLLKIIIFKLSEKFYSKCSIFNLFLSMIPQRVKNTIASILYKIYYKRKTIWYVFPSCFFKSFVKFKLYGLSLNIPIEVEKYLEYRYGPRWKIKDKNWKLLDGNFLRVRSINYYDNQVDLNYMKIKSCNLSMFNFSKDEIKLLENKDINV